MDPYQPRSLVERIGFRAYLFAVGAGRRDLESLVDEALSDERGVGSLEPPPRPEDPLAAAAMSREPDGSPREAERVSPG